MLRCSAILVSACTCTHTRQTGTKGFCLSVVDSSHVFHGSFDYIKQRWLLSFSSLLTLGYTNYRYLYSWVWITTTNQERHMLLPAVLFWHRSYVTQDVHFTGGTTNSRPPSCYVFDGQPSQAGKHQLYGHSGRAHVIPITIPDFLISSIWDFEGFNF